MSSPCCLDKLCNDRCGSWSIWCRFPMIGSFAGEGGNDQLNLSTIFASTSSLLAMANNIPGQPLLPDPNGINSNACPLKSIKEIRNLSGRDSSGSSQVAASLWIAQALVMTCVPVAMSYSLILTS